MKQQDERGSIENIMENFTGDVIFIKTKAPAVRAQHWHKTTGHWCYVTKGEIVYYERVVGESGKPTKTTYKEGDIFWTGPGICHAMVFNEDTDFVCLSTGGRNKEDYEADLVRLNYDLTAE